MTHLTVEQLLAVREPGLEPGVQGWRDHVAGCDGCRAALDRLDQRIARLRALPVLKPSRSRLVEVQALTGRWRLRRRLLVLSLGGLALAATVALAVMLAPTLRRSPPTAQLAEQRELEDVIARSQQLEDVIQGFDPDRRVTDGRTALVAASLEDRVARIDQQLQLMNLTNDPTRSDAALRLWRQRVGLLDALVDVHTTGASFVRY